MTSRPRNQPAADAGVLLREDDRAAQAARLARLDEPHVAPLTAWVRRVRDETGEDVPWPDPLGGGVDAEVVLLRRDPRCSAVRGAGIATAHTDDPASGNLLTALAAADVPWSRVLLADVVPWWVEDPSRDEEPGRRRRVAREARRAAGYVQELFGLLPRARGAVLLGGGAQSAWRAAHADTAVGCPVVAAPSPSPMVWWTRDRDGRLRREVLVERIAEAASGQPSAR